MSSLRLVLPALLGLSFLLIGYLMSGSYEQEFGRTLVIAGSIIIAGVIIASAIVETDRRRKL